MVPFWLSIPALVAVLSGGCIFAICQQLKLFQKFMGFTLVFDGLFLMLGSVISENLGQFIAPTYLLYVILMLLIPFFYYFATRFLVKKEGIENKDFWMLEIVFVYALVLLTIMNRVPAQDRDIFQSIISGGSPIGAHVPTGTAVLLGMDDLAFILFLTEMLFIQIFCFIGLYNYKNTLAAYYSNTDGKSLNIIYLMFALVTIRFVVFVGQSFLPIVSSSTWYHIIQTVSFSLFYVVIAIFTCKINYTADELGQMIKEQNSKPTVPVANELIKSRMDEMINSRFFLDPDVDLMKTATKMQVNYKYLSDYLHHNYKESFMVFVNRLRIEYSAALMKDDNLSLEDLAEQSGFTSPSTFYRNFVKYTGVTPSKYKKNN